jgi:hypothetical protein
MAMVKTQKPVIFLCILLGSCCVKSYSSDTASTVSTSLKTESKGQRAAGTGRYVGLNYTHLLPGIEAGYVFSPKYMRLGIGAGLSYYNPFRMNNVPHYPKASVPVTFMVGTPVLGAIVSLRGYYRNVFFVEKNFKSLSSDGVAGAALDLWMSRIWSIALGFESGFIGSLNSGKDDFFSTPYAGVRFQL